jgi:hypothetical protein
MARAKGLFIHQKGRFGGWREQKGAFAWMRLMAGAKIKGGK